MRYLIPVIAVLSILVMACGGGGDSSGVQVTAVSAPEDLGNAIAQTQVKLLEEAQQLFKSEPTAAGLKDKLPKFKEGYVQAFVKLGKQRDALDDQQKAVVSAAANAYMAQNGPKDMSWLAEAADRYGKLDGSLPGQVVSINSLSQYAFFEVVRQRMPQEAQRLGIQ